MELFISYAKEDYNTAIKLYSDLKKYGLNPWIDSEKILPGEKWRSKIIHLIKDSRFFLSLISSTSVSKKGFVQKELNNALNKSDEYPDSESYIIPVRIDPCKIPNKLEEYHCIDLFPSYEKALLKILESILPEFLKPENPPQEKDSTFFTVTKNKIDTDKLLGKLIREEKPNRANILQYSSDKIFSLLEIFCEVETEVFLLLQHPEVANLMAGDMQRKKICMRIGELLTSLPKDFPKSNIAIRCYEQKASVRGIKFGNYVCIGWYTYDIRLPGYGKNQIWGHDNPHITLKLDSAEGKIIESSFDKTFKNLWYEGVDLKTICGECNKMSCGEDIKKSIREVLDQINSKDLKI